jgi:hypothetical protein
MESDWLRQLEQRLAQVETELAAAHLDIAELRQRATRARSFGRRTSVIAAGSLLAILTLTATSAGAGAPLAPSTVKAPFTVESATGNVLFTVEDASGAGRAIAYDHTGKSTVSLEPNPSGGMSLRFYNGATLQAAVAGTAKGGLLQLNNTAGNKMTLIGSSATSGTVAIYNADGKTKGLLGTDPKSGDGEFDLFNADGTTPAVQLSEVAGGGYISVTNRAGVARVELGTLPSDQGIVRAFGPGGFDYIRGRK